MFPRRDYNEKSFSDITEDYSEGVLTLERRYEILRAISYFQPVGRRILANHLGISERIIRNETDFLKQNVYIKVTSLGMEITQEGHNILQELEGLIYDLRGLTELEKQLSKILNIDKVVVVPGDTDKNEMVKKDIGKAAARIFRDIIKPGNTIAITGGTTVAQMINSFQPLNNNYEDVFVLPARGSIGNKVEYQSNTLASQLAYKLGADYKLLNIPDHLSKKSLESISKEPEIKDTLQKVSNTDILIFGIGNALKMAKRRGLLEPVIDFLRRKEAVAEAFGYYFNLEGEIVYNSRSVGIQLDEIKNISYMIAVAGGSSKAEAIMAVEHLLKGLYSHG